MKKYNISSTTNLTSDDKFFLGTGFMGAEFSTMDDLKALLRKYATFEKEGDRQAKENGIVELFSCMAACAKDPFRGISIIYRPSKWIDKDGSEFAFILVKGNEVIPQKNKKLRDILRELGIEI